MRQILGPPKRVKVRIRFVDGPLDRKTGTTFNTPKYRDADGLGVTYEHGRDLIDGNARLGGTAQLYYLDADHRTYRWLPQALVDERTRRIQELLEQKEQHPEQAEKIEAEIQALEERSG